MPGAQMSNIKGEFIDGALQIKDTATNLPILDIGATTGIRVQPAGYVTVVTTGTTLAATHAGRVIMVTAGASTVIALPSTAAGLTYTIVNAGSSGQSIIVNAGAGATVTSDTFVGAGRATTDLPYRLTNTAATAKHGDMIVVNSGISTGTVWYVAGLVGTWVSTT